MLSAIANAPGKTGGMAKQKKTNRKTPRVNVGFPEDWHAVLRRIAAKKRQPVVYLLIEMAAAEAAKYGIDDLPPAPWGEEEE